MRTAPSPSHPFVRLDPTDRADLHDLFVEYRRTGDIRLRNRIVEAHLHLADWSARRYGDHVLREDLRQVAQMAIVHAAERFDPLLGVSFRTFASRTIEGDCKRFLRDRSWNVRPPRAVLELALAVRRHQEELGHVLGRVPTVDEIADHLDTTTELVLEAMEAYRSRRGVSIEPEGPDEPVSASVSQAISEMDVGYGIAEDRAAVAHALSRLSARERELLCLRFADERSQSDLAEHLGLSQSYVSRFLNSTLQQLRREVGSC